MASSAVKLSFLFLFTVLSIQQCRARDSLHFNRASATTDPAADTPNAKQPPLNNDDDVDGDPQPSDFLRGEANYYGLDSHESWKLPSPTAEYGKLAVEKSKPLPTEDKDDDDDDDEDDLAACKTDSDEDATEGAEPDVFSGKDGIGGGSFYTRPQELPRNTKPAGGAARYNTVYRRYNGGEEGRSFQQGVSDTKPKDTGAERYNPVFPLPNDAENDAYFQEGLKAASYAGDDSRYKPVNRVPNGGEDGRYFQQGLSDTRFLENGKYFYDINTGKYSNSRPDETPEREESKYRNVYGNGGKVIGGSDLKGYDNFSKEESLP